MLSGVMVVVEGKAGVGGVWTSGGIYTVGEVGRRPGQVEATCALVRTAVGIGMNNINATLWLCNKCRWRSVCWPDSLFLYDRLVQ